MPRGNLASRLAIVAILAPNARATLPPFYMQFFLCLPYIGVIGKVPVCHVLITTTALPPYRQKAAQRRNQAIRRCFPICARVWNLGQGR